MRRFVPFFMIVAAASGCSVLDRARTDATPAAAVAPEPEAVAPPPANPIVLGEGRSASALDTTTAAEKAEALAAPASAAERELGKVVVSLGSPTEPGIWLRTTLVSAAGKGRVVTAGGQSVAVDLLPGSSGAQLSLAAFRALGLNLTDLPEVTVYAQ
ncbi:hypothetical protein ACSBLW_04595 [Thioclava sp. FR2]|uniref:hypothetical protein n=1 Tax=Thioclava sp. FR2 TaxID=3445780 RepID=UPI003EB91B40